MRSIAGKILWKCIGAILFVGASYLAISTLVKISNQPLGYRLTQLLSDGHDGQSISSRRTQQTCSVHPASAARFPRIGLPPNRFSRERFSIGQQRLRTSDAG